MDFTNEITADDELPLVVIHGTEDHIVPYVYAEAVADRAWLEGLETHLITLDGAPHLAWPYLHEYRFDLLGSLFDVLDLEGSEPYRSDCHW